MQTTHFSTSAILSEIIPPVIHMEPLYVQLNLNNRTHTEQYGHATYYKTLNQHIEIDRIHIKKEVNVV